MPSMKINRKNNRKSKSNMTPHASAVDVAVDVTIDRLTSELRQLEKESNQQLVRRELEIALLEHHIANVHQVRKEQRQVRQEVLQEFGDVLSNAFKGTTSPMVSSDFGDLFTGMRNLSCTGHKGLAHPDTAPVPAAATATVSTHKNMRMAGMSTNANVATMMGMTNGAHADTDADQEEMDIMWRRIKTEPKEVQIMWKRIKSDMKMRNIRHGGMKIKAVRRTKTRAPRRVTKQFNQNVRNRGYNRDQLLKDTQEKAALDRTQQVMAQATMHQGSMDNVLDELRLRVHSMVKVHRKNDAVLVELVQRLLVREVCRKNKARKEKKAKVHSVLAELMKKFLVREIHDRSEAQEETRKKIAQVLTEFTRQLVLQEISKTTFSRFCVQRHRQKVSRELMERFHAQETMRRRTDELLREMVMEWVIAELKEVSDARSEFVGNYRRLTQELTKLFLVKELNQRSRDKETYQAKTARVLRELRERMDEIETIELRQLMVQDLMHMHSARHEHGTNVAAVLAELLHKHVVNEMKIRCAAKERTDLMIKELKERLEWVDIKEGSKKYANEWVEIPDPEEWVMCH